MADRFALTTSEAAELLTTEQAAEHCGMGRRAFAQAMHLARKHGRDLRADRSLWIDRRTPVYDPAVLDAWLASRPGQGRRTRREDQQ